MLGRLGATEIMVILGVGFLLFGPKKLPQLGKSFGETISEFKKAAKNEEISADEIVEKKGHEE